MTEKIKIFLGDLTYNTISLSTEVFPLNIGYIASYCIKRFNDFVDIRLFKYIDDLENAIYESPPDILGLSNYAWCHNISKEMFKLVLEKNPFTLTVWGGPNFPQDLPSQQEFMDKMKGIIDVYVPIEGELGFSNLVEKCIHVRDRTKFKEITASPINGCISRNDDGKIVYGLSDNRINELDEIPSPYLEGLLDKFFDGKLSPIIQTNRGCPFSCTFCTDGSENVSRVNNFSIKRVEDEIEYIAKKIPKNIHSMTISDLNFGMWPRDLDICKIISRIQKEYGFPKLIQSTTGKNKKERIVESIKLLNGALRVMMSVQSMDEQVLSNIRRDNISKETMISLAPSIKEANLSTTAEVILGLPGETYESHIKTLRDLTQANINYVRPYTLMLLNGSELNTPKERSRWGFVTKYRILPKDFVKLKNGKNIVEVEEVAVATKTLQFDEYVKLRTIAYIMFVTNIGFAFDSLIKFLRENKIDVFELFLRTLMDLNRAPNDVKDIINRFQKSTRDELWESPKEIESHYQIDENYNRLLSGEDGINVIQHYQAIVMFQIMESWTDYTLDIAKDLLKEKNLSSDKMIQFEDIENFCRGTTFKILDRKRMEKNPKFPFGYNVIEWLRDDNNSELDTYKFNVPKKIEFSFSKEQFELVEDGLDQCGESDVGKSRIFRWVPPDSIWRRPRILD